MADDQAAMLEEMMAELAKRMTNMATSYLSQHPGHSRQDACEEGMRMGLLLAAKLIHGGLPVAAFYHFVDDFLDRDGDGVPV